MSARWLAAPVVAAAVVAGLPACSARPVAVPSAAARPSSPPLDTRLDALLADAALEGAAIAVRIESLADGRVVYSRNDTARMIPASVLKILTAAVAAERLGWSHRFETRLDATGPVIDGVLEGDLVVVGDGDPTINAQNLLTAPLFDEWARRLRADGVVVVAGRLIGDDRAFAEEPLGAGWAWDYLTATYAAPSGALSYNENLVAVRVAAGPAVGSPATVSIAPPGHGLTIRSTVVTGAPGTSASVTFDRLPGADTLTVRGQVPADGPDVVRATTVANPTMFFVNGLLAALRSQGIDVRGGASAIGDLANPPADDGSARRVIGTRLSPPLSSLVAEMLKVSQNFYGEMLIKAIGRTAADTDGVGSTEAGRQVVLETLAGWGLSTDSLVMYDGSGLSRYDYVDARLVTAVLRRMWDDPVHRGPFAAALPVAGHDGTLGSRMTDLLRRRVQAKTGTIANVRSLAGYTRTLDDEPLVFTMIANHFVAPAASIDRVMEAVLEAVVRGEAGAVASARLQ